MIRTHHTKTPGDIAVAKVIADLTVNGMAVLIPVGCEHLPYDLVADTGDRLLKIQVKRSAAGYLPTETNWEDRNGTHRRKYADSAFDYYAMYMPTVDAIAYANIKLAGITICAKLPNSSTPFYWYKDFATFTDNPVKHTFRDFGITLSHASRKQGAVNRGWQPKINWPTDSELEKLLWAMPTQQLAKQLGVSDNAIAHRASNRGLSKPARGYWTKVAAGKVPPTGFEPTRQT